MQIVACADFHLALLETLKLFVLTAVIFVAVAFSDLRCHGLLAFAFSMRGNGGSGYSIVRDIRRLANIRPAVNKSFLPDWFQTQASFPLMHDIGKTGVFVKDFLFVHGCIPSASGQNIRTRRKPRCPCCIMALFNHRTNCNAPHLVSTGKTQIVSGPLIYHILTDTTRRLVDGLIVTSFLMHILISNDDGYQSLGINILRKHLSREFRVTVVAPGQNRSAASNSLTVERPLRVQQIEPGVYSVDGTPTDCVHLAITGLLEADLPDMLVSGINHGENLGDDVIYSGTVAAAMEGRFLGFPALAVSALSEDRECLESAAVITARLLKDLLKNTVLEGMVFNINVPRLPLSEIRGIRPTRLGNRHLAKPVIQQKDPRGKPIYWVGSAGDKQDAGPGTDFHAVGEGYVSATPLHADLTSHSAIPVLSEWLETCYGRSDDCS